MATSRDTVSVKDCALEVARSMGYKDLKEEQVLVVSEFVGGKDVFVALPMGYGKSFCYGCLPGVFQRFKGGQNGIVVVVSPLVAIMKDQVASFEKKGVSAAHLAGSVDQEVTIGVVSGSYSLVFMSPEQLLTVQKWRSMLQSVYREKLVPVSPDKPNVIFTVSLCTTLEEAFIPLME